MILGKLELNEQQTMSFGINIFGTTEPARDIRFIIEGDKFDVICRCKTVGEEIEVEIPPMKGILESKEYKARLEIIIGDKIFSPLKESTVEFNPLIEFGVEKKDLKTTQESVEITVKGATTTDSKKSKLQEAIDKVHADGYEVSQLNGFNVIMQGDKYIGFVTEDKTIFADIPYALLGDLVDSLSK